MEGAIQFRKPKLLPVGDSCRFLRNTVPTKMDMGGPDAKSLPCGRYDIADLTATKTHERLATNQTSGVFAEVSEPVPGLLRTREIEIR